MKDFQDKVAVITGGASGIGFATARALAKLGSRLVLADIEDDALVSAANELASAGASVIGVRTDVVAGRAVRAVGAACAGELLPVIRR